MRGPTIGRRLGVLAPQLGVELQRPSSDGDGAALPRLRLRALAHRHGQARRRGRHKAADDRLLHPNPSQGRRKVRVLAFFLFSIFYIYSWYAMGCLDAVFLHIRRVFFLLDYC